MKMNQFRNKMNNKKMKIVKNMKKMTMMKINLLPMNKKSQLIKKIQFSRWSLLSLD